MTTADGCLYHPLASGLPDVPCYPLAATMPFGLAGMSAAAAVGAAQGLRLPGQSALGAVLLVSNLNEQVRQVVDFS